MEKTYYFTDYNKVPGGNWPYESGEYWQIDPQDACNDSITDYAEGFAANGESLNFILTANNCPGTNLGAISKVEVRGYIEVDDNCTVEFIFLPPGGGMSGFAYFTNVGPAWTNWYDITSFDTPFTWATVKDFDFLLQLVAKGVPEGRARAYAVEVRVTYTAAAITSPFPTLHQN